MHLEIAVPDRTEKRPRVKLDCTTFEEWEALSESYFQCVYNHGRSQRSCYDMRGQSLFEETYIPWNIFKDETVVYKLTDFNVTKSCPTMLLAEEYGGEWEQGYYAEEGYGWPVFAEAEHAWHFLIARENAKLEEVMG